jgi:antitoxin component HigA of HigAB toxin-antitoxin module
VRREGSKTYISGEIDLEQLAEEADAALQQGFANLSSFPEYDAQEALLNTVNSLLDRMGELGMTSAQLARKMDVAPSYVSRVLNATPNLTVLSLSKLARAVGGKITINLVIDDAPDKVGGPPAPPALPPPPAAD